MKSHGGNHEEQEMEVVEEKQRTPGSRQGMRGGLSFSGGNLLQT